MKKILAASILTLAFTLANAQESYTIKANIKTEGMPAEYAAYGEQEITTYVKGDKYKSEVTSMMFSSTSYFDGKTYCVLSEAMGNKSGFKATAEEMEAEDKKNKDEKPKIEITAEKKTIAGYECTKTIITVQDKESGKETKITLWVTDKIKSSQKMRGNRMGFDMSEIKGAPLEMEMPMSANGMDMKVVMTTTEVLTSAIDDATFIPNTEGYKLMSYVEFKDSMKAKRGGR